MESVQLAHSEELAYNFLSHCLQNSYYSFLAKKLLEEWVFLIHCQFFIPFFPFSNLRFPRQLGKTIVIFLDS